MISRMSGNASAIEEAVWVAPSDLATSSFMGTGSTELLGGVDTIVELESGHDAMISSPEALAGLLIDVVDRLGVSPIPRTPTEGPTV